MTTRVNRSRKPTTPERPTGVELGHVIIEEGQKLVYIGRGTWAWFPVQAHNLTVFAQANGWGVRTEIVGVNEHLGTDEEGAPLIKPYVRVILYVGRNPGPTKNGQESKGYLYRFMWDTREIGTFRLVSKYKRTSDFPTWMEIASMYELKPIIHANPVVNDA